MADKRKPTEDHGLDTGELIPDTAVRPGLETGVERPSLWHTLDLAILIGALAAIAAGAGAYRAAATPPLTTEAHLGLQVSRPAFWLSQRIMTEPSPLALAAGGTGELSRPGTSSLPRREVWQSPTVPRARLEVTIDRRPVFKNWRGALTLARVGRYGETYWTKKSDVKRMSGRDWVRTEFQYAYTPRAGDSPKVATGIEYATLHGDLLYVVTFHGDERGAGELSALLAKSLTVAPSASTTAPETER